MNGDKYKFLKLILLLLFVLNLSFVVEAQKVKQKSEKKETQVDSVSNADFKAALKTYKLNSKLMAREMPYNVFLPLGYDWDKSKEKHYPVIYLLHGLMGHFDNWAAKTKLDQYVLQANAIIVMPEGNDGWYTDSAAENNDRYESYIIQELIPEIDKKFRTIADKKHRAIAGLSMGGYGSIKFGLKHTEIFSLVGSFSGALSVTALTEKEIGSKGAFAESILSIFGGVGSQTRKENDIFQIVRDMPKEKIKDLPFIYLDCGTEDFLYKSNREFSELLAQKKIPHEYRELPGAHNWVFWDSQVQEFLELSNKFIK